MRTIRLWEVLAVIGVVGILAAIFLPALARARESARRSSCQNNLKQMGLVIKMYTSESAGVYPRPSCQPGNWTMDMACVYPEYLTDPQTMICPSSPHMNSRSFTLRHDNEHPGALLGKFHPDCASHLFYVYTGYEILDDAQAEALFAARNALPQGSFGDNDVAVPRNGGEGLNRAAGAEGDQCYLSMAPVVWDRIGGARNIECNHAPIGANVLYADGHVEFMKYSCYNQPEDFPATRVAVETFGNSTPALSRDCYD